MRVSTEEAVDFPWLLHHRFLLKAFGKTTQPCGASLRGSSLRNTPTSENKGKVMVCRLLLVATLLLCLSVQLSVCQHWSHGWYPGGKREIDSYSSPEMSGEIKLCEAGECSYLRPRRTNILKSILLDALMKELQKRK